MSLEEREAGGAAGEEGGRLKIETGDWFDGVKKIILKMGISKMSRGC